MFDTVLIGKKSGQMKHELRFLREYSSQRFRIKNTAFHKLTVRKPNKGPTVRRGEVIKHSHNGTETGEDAAQARPDGAGAASNKDSHISIGSHVGWIGAHSSCPFSQHRSTNKIVNSNDGGLMSLVERQPPSQYRPHPPRHGEGKAFPRLNEQVEPRITRIN